MRLLLTISFSLLMFMAASQVKWFSDNQLPKDINWDNYSTSYVDKQNLSTPILVTAIPYNGTNANFSDIGNELDLSSTAALYRFKSNLKNFDRKFYTYDSAEVYFLAPGIFRSNSSQYEYRVMLNASTSIKPWSAITIFTDSNFRLSDFKSGMAFLGGFKTSWDNFLLVQIRRTGTQEILNSSLVYWKQTKPVINGIYTAGEFIDLLTRAKGQTRAVNSRDTAAGHPLYERSSTDTSSTPAKEILISPDNENIVFEISGDIFKKEALEYELVKDRKIIRPWGFNDFDNNFIWIKNIRPGDYELKIRLSSQRHNGITYRFHMEQEWFNRPLSRILFILAFAVIFSLIFTLVKQKQKTSAAIVKKEKLNLELKALRSQLNPHFVFNALSSIQGLMNRNDTDAANHYLTEFSSLLRESLKNGESEYLPLARELKMLDTYLQLEQLRFRFHYTVSVEKTMPVAEIEIPALLIQPLVENAIKHGAGPKQDSGSLEISYSCEGKNLLINIKDNGPGFDLEQAVGGFGLKLVKERINLLNQSLNEQQIKLTAESDFKSFSIVHLVFENWI